MIAKKWEEEGMVFPFEGEQEDLLDCCYDIATNMPFTLEVWEWSTSRYKLHVDQFSPEIVELVIADLTRRYRVCGTFELEEIRFKNIHCLFWLVDLLQGIPFTFKNTSIVFEKCTVDAATEDDTYPLFAVFPFSQLNHVKFFGCRLDPLFCSRMLEWIDTRATDKKHVWFESRDLFGKTELIRQILNVCSYHPVDFKKTYYREPLLKLRYIKKRRLTDGRFMMEPIKEQYVNPNAKAHHNQTNFIIEQQLVFQPMVACHVSWDENNTPVIVNANYIPKEEVFVSEIVNLEFLRSIHC